MLTFKDLPAGDSQALWSCHTLRTQHLESQQGQQVPPGPFLRLITTFLEDKAMPILRHFQCYNWRGLSSSEMFLFSTELLCVKYT